MIPSDLVGQPLEVLKIRGFSFSGMSEEQKQDAIWWDEHYKNSYKLPLQGMAESRYKTQDYKTKKMTFITGQYEVFYK